MISYDEIKYKLSRVDSALEHNRITLGEYDERIDKILDEIRSDAIKEFAKWLDAMGYLNSVEVDYDWDENPYETTYILTAEEVLEEYKQMKGEQNELGN